MSDVAKRNNRFAWMALAVLLTMLIGAMSVAGLVQRDFGRVHVSNVRFANFNGIVVRAKLFVPDGVDENNPAPGIVYLHGYQNNRETSDPYCIELARRGFVVLNLDTIGRGNSGIPGELTDPDFDETYGGLTALAYLRGLEAVDPDRTGMMGHSLGGEMAYGIALEDPALRAVAFSGFAYRDDATFENPANMLMIFGRYDEYRRRMTGTEDYAGEWLLSPQTEAVIPVDLPEFGVTYGDFASGTARMVYMPETTHVAESFDRGAIAAAVNWMRQALEPDASYWIPPEEQIWPWKEGLSLLAMLSGTACIFPASILLLDTPWFRKLRRREDRGEGYVCTARDGWRHAIINGALMLLYLPLILVIFGFHMYVLRIDKVFPMMMVNGIVFWFVMINLMGFLLFRRWARRRGIDLRDLGISSLRERIQLRGMAVGRRFLYAAILFAVVCGLEHLLEQIFLVDFRYTFPFASDFTGYRLLMFLLYFPFLLAGFLQTGIFLHGQLRILRRGTMLRTFMSRTVVNLAAMTVPLLLLLALQYVPLYLWGTIPFVGPGAALVGFVINLLHIIVVLLMVVPLSTWLYELTGNIYAGAIISALLVAWMFTSSSVIAPIPV